MVAYAGPFTSEYRSQLELLWVNELKSHAILHTERITMRSFLGDPVKIQNWNITSLPKDDSSTENGIIIDQVISFYLTRIHQFPFQICRLEDGH